MELSKINSRNRATNEQLELLLSYMESHSLFARNQITKLGKQGKEKYNDMWNKLTEQLNECGNAKKDSQGWQKTWTNLRLKSKQKKALYMKSFRKTGNAEPDVYLDDVDNRISNIFNNFGLKDNLIKEVGVPPMRQPLEFLDFDNQLDGSRQRPSAEQVEYMYTFMENNKSFAQKDLTPSMMKSMWSRLTTKLNSIEGGQARPTENWKKTWSEIKQRTEQRYDLLINGNDNCRPLSDQNLRVLRILGKNNTPGSDKVAAQTSSSLKNESEIPRLNGLSIQDMGFLLDVPIAAASTLDNKKRKLSPQPSTSKSNVIYVSDEDVCEEPIIKKQKKGMTATSTETYIQILKNHSEMQNKNLQLICEILLEIREKLSSPCSKCCTASVSAATESKTEESQHESVEYAIINVKNDASEFKIDDKHLNVDSNDSDLLFFDL